MAKVRILVFLATIVIVGSVLYVASLFARGYRFDFQTFKFTPNGLLILKSVPDGAQIYIDTVFKTATNATIPLSPGTYDIKVEKAGSFAWEKRITIEKEIVTEATAHLFKIAPSLSAITFSGTINPTPSRDFSKIAYAVPQQLGSTNGSSDISGLWVVEMLNLPLGFSREPRRVTDGDLTQSSWEWSPDGREILLTTARGTYLISSSTFTSQSQMTNVISGVGTIRKEWDAELQKRREAQIAKLPSEVEDILSRKSSEIVLSPDEDLVLYTASGSATLADNLIKQLPGASTQKQERTITSGRTYVYDIKEDRNFMIIEDSKDLIIEGGTDVKVGKRLSWFPTSRHLLLAENDRVTIMDYDGTNRQTVYSGAYLAPHAYPTLSLDRIMILTNLGGISSLPNLYSVGIK